MPNWLNPVIDLLDRAETPVQVFFRDDDAGWANDKLYSLLDTFAQVKMPIDLAVIPESLHQNLADELLVRWQQENGYLGLHQHGFSHVNHEVDDRKCEFGHSRTKLQQKDDLASGQVYLKGLFGNALDPFFTPPWNRCTQATVECLEELDFKVLSRDITAKVLSSSTLRQIPVHIDWSGIIRKSAHPLAELCQRIVNNLSNNQLTGIMLHHADMDNAQLETLRELLAVFKKHHNVHGLLLRATLG